MSQKLIENSAIPYSIVHATQFFEFVRRMADEATDGSTVRFAPVMFQPIAGDDVARDRQDRSGFTAERESQGRRTRAVPDGRVLPERPGHA